MKRILWTIAVLIIPPFVFWGGGSLLRSKDKGPAFAGICFGRRVSFEDYGAAWQAAKNQALLMYGQKFNEVYETLNLNMQAWDRLILLTEAKREGIKVSDREVIETIQNFPFLQSKGQFDKRAYDLILTQVFRTTPRQFEEEIRGTLVILKLRDSVIQDVKVTNNEIKEAYKKENEKSKIAYIMITQTRFKDKVKISQEAIERYFNDNAESFSAQDQVNCEYLGFEFTDEPGSKEKALSQAEKMDYILADKAKGFEEAARENSIPIKETGFFSRQGPIPQIGWFPEIPARAFKMEVGERSDLIKSSMEFVRGYYIIRVKEKRPSYIPALEEVKEKIENMLKDEGASRLAFKEAQRIHRKLKELTEQRHMRFEQAAVKILRKPKYTEPFTRNDYIPGIGLAQELGEAAFTAKDGAISSVIKTRAGNCILTTLEIIPINERGFKKERKKFSEKTLEAKKNSVLNEWYLDLMRRANLKNNIPAEENK